MEAFKSSLRSASSDGHQRTSSFPLTAKRSSSPRIIGISSVSSDSTDSRSSTVPERKPSPSQQERQRTVKVSEMQQWNQQLQEELRRAKEERTQVLDVIEQLKKRRNEELGQIQEKMRMLEEEAEKAKESERKMLESLISQTKQLEQTKISLEEAKLEISNHHENMRSMKNPANFSGYQLEKNGYLEQIRMLKNELRLATEAEEKSKKAMDEFAIALKEANSELLIRKSELAKSKEEAETANFLLDKLKLDVNCMKVSEEEMKKKDEENLKLRDLIKHAVNEATVIKESLEIARCENYELKEQIFKKEDELQRIQEDYQNLKLIQAENSKKASSLLETESKIQADYADGRMILSKFPSARWSQDNGHLRQSGRRHSVADPGRFAYVSNGGNGGMSSSLFIDDKGYNTDDFDRIEGMLAQDVENEKEKKKKKTVLRRFGDALRRRSFRKQ